MGTNSKSKKVKENSVKTSETGKPRKKRPHESSPVIGTNGFNITPDDANKITSVTLRLMKMKPIDVNDYDAVEKRLEEYFLIYAESGLKPTVSGMASALGHNRQWLYSVANNYPAGGRGYVANVKEDCAYLIKRCYRVLEEQWENYMLNGKINPVSGIFFGKNHYNYQDRQEHIITPQNQEEQYSAESIKERYMISEKSEN